MFNLRTNTIHFLALIRHLITDGTFIFLTIVGNSVVCLFSYLFYFLEKDSNSHVRSYLDAVWWGYSTTTTVGYGDIIPVTPEGKILGIFLMLVGTALFATYTGLFAQIIIHDEGLKLKIFKRIHDNKSMYIEELKQQVKILKEQVNCNKDD